MRNRVLNQLLLLLANIGAVATGMSVAKNLCLAGLPRSVGFAVAVLAIALPTWLIQKRINEMAFSAWREKRGI